MSRVPKAVRSAIWDEMQESFKMEIGGDESGATTVEPHQAYWVNARIPIIKIPISSAYTIKQASERGEVFGGLLALNVAEHVKLLNDFNVSCGSPNVITTEAFRTKRIDEFTALEGVEGAALAAKGLGWTNKVTTAFFQGAKKSFQEN